MKGLSILLGCILAGAASISFAADPSFKVFKVTEVFAGPNHAPVPYENSNQRMDEARAQALAGKVNFAGHYVLHRMGCGGSTMCVEVLDAQTGEIATGLPNAYDGNALVLSYRPDSNLIIVYGITVDTEEDLKGKQLKNRYRTRYYEFVNNELRLLKITDA
jgi:hypothetical protein